MMNVQEGGTRNAQGGIQKHTGGGDTETHILYAKVWPTDSQKDVHKKWCPLKKPFLLFLGHPVVYSTCTRAYVYTSFVHWEKNQFSLISLYSMPSTFDQFQ